MRTRSRSARATLDASAALRPRTFTGASMMFSSTVMCGNRLRLEDHADTRAQGREIDAGRGERLPEHDKLAALDGLERVHAADQGALARARRTAHDDHLAHLHGEVDVAQDVDIPEPLVDVPELDHCVGHQVITTRTSPAFTAWPGCTRTSATVPGARALSSFSIFIASITRSVSPAATVSPASTATCVIFPGRGAVSVWGPAPAAAPALVRMR